jgi:hypothetical protein
VPLPAWRPDEEPPDVDPDRVAAVAAGHGFPPAALLVVLRRWLLVWWAAEGRRRARERSDKDAAWAEARGDAAGAEEARARRHRGTARAWRLERHAARQPTPELEAQARERAAGRLPDPPEPSLTTALAVLWLECRGVLPAPGSGTKANPFVRFVDECAVAVGLHAPDVETRARWRRRWQREHARIMQGLSGGRPVRP